MAGFFGKNKKKAFITIVISFAAFFIVVTEFSGHSFHVIGAAYSGPVAVEQENFLLALVGRSVPEMISSFTGTLFIISGFAVVSRLMQKKKKHSPHPVFAQYLRHNPA